MSFHHDVCSLLSTIMPVGIKKDKEQKLVDEKREFTDLIRNMSLEAVAEHEVKVTVESPPALAASARGASSPAAGAPQADRPHRSDAACPSAARPSETTMAVAAKATLGSGWTPAPATDGTKPVIAQL